MTIAQEALRDAAVTLGLLLSPIIVYIFGFCFRYFIRRIKERRAAGEQREAA